MDLAAAGAAALPALVRTLTVQKYASLQPGIASHKAHHYVSRAFIKDILRLVTGSVAPQTPQLCASQNQLFPTSVHHAFEHLCSHETRLKTLVLLPIPEKGAVIILHQTNFIWSAFYPPLKKALCCHCHYKQSHLIMVKPTGWTMYSER